MNKKHFVKALICSMALCMVFSLCGCGGSGTQGSQESSANPIKALLNTDDSGTEEQSFTGYLYGNIIGSGECGKKGDNVTWTLDNSGLLVVSGSGEMDDHDTAKGWPWYDKRDLIKTVVIENGVTVIGRSAFRDCTNLTSITIPDSVTRIGQSSLNKCTSLTSITIPDSVTSFGDYAFSGCTGMTSITIPESVASVEECVFYKWTSSQTIYIKGKNYKPSGWKSRWDFRCDAKIVWDA